MTLDSCISYLKNNGYVISQGGSLVFTNKANREMNNPGALVVAGSHTLALAQQMITPRDIFKKFIIEAQVPRKTKYLDKPNYVLSAISKTGTDAFMKVYNDPRVNYQVLVASTNLYYKQQNVMLNIITNYFVKGTWEVEYDEMCSKIEQGQIQEYVTETVIPRTSNTRIG